MYASFGLPLYQMLGGAVRDGVWFPGSVGVAVGDFDGDSLNEIAVTWQDDTGRFHLTLLTYRETDTGGRTLSVIGDPAGVTLFADDPIVFKKLIYEMRFDPASSRFALFGPFYVGMRCAPSDLGAALGATG